MHIVDFILNVVGVLLWLSWRAIHVEEVARPGTSLVATLKPASPPGSRWVYLASLGGLLVGRAFIYWLIAPRIPWIPRLSLGLTTLAFGPASEALRGDVILRFLLFSFLSFGLAMAWFYMCLLFLSAINAKMPENHPHQRFIQLHLGWFEYVPRWLKLAVPLAVATVLWCGLNPVLARLNIAPHAPASYLAGQGALLGAVFYVHLQYPLALILALHLVDSYVYLGENSFWKWITLTSGNLVAPLRWMPLVIWKIDLAPPLGIALLIGGPILWAHMTASTNWDLHQIFQRLIVV